MSEGRVSGIGQETPHWAFIEPVRSSWVTRRQDKARRLERVAKIARGRVLPTEEIVPALEELIAPGDRVVLEGDNQHQPPGSPGSIRARHRHAGRLLLRRASELAGGATLGRR